MSRTYSTVGIVLRRRNINESDKLITFYSKYKGKITAIAKGVRKIHSRKAAHLEIFNLIHAYLVKGRSLDIITEVITIQSYPNIRISLKRLSRTYLVLEEIDKLCPEGMANIQIFNELLKVLEHLNAEENTNFDLIIYNFTHKILWELGYLPEKTYLNQVKLDNYMMSIIEKQLNSNKLLTKINNIL